MPVRLTTGRTGRHNNVPWLELTPPKRKTGEKRKEKTGVLPSPVLSQDKKCSVTVSVVDF
jgi:hypothetical protein